MTTIDNNTGIEVLKNHCHKLRAELTQQESQNDFNRSNLRKGEEAVEDARKELETIEALIDRLEGENS